MKLFKILGLISLFFFVTLNVAEARKLIIVGEPWPPFEYLDENNQVVGVNIDLITPIFKKNECHLKMTGQSYQYIFIYILQKRVEVDDIR